MRRSLAALVAISVSIWCAGAASAQSYGDAHRDKVEVGGKPRKIVVFLPKDIRRNEHLPLLVAVPDTKGKCMEEVGQWEHDAYMDRFVVVSADSTTSQGWLPSHGLEMEQDEEAYMKAIEKAEKLAPIDDTAIVITGQSGGSYLALWMALRHPKLFLGVCIRAGLFFKEEVQFEKGFKPNLDLPIFIYYGNLDPYRTPKESVLAVKTLQEKGFRDVKYRVIKNMVHESNPGVCLDWFQKLLKKTERGRKTVRRIREQLVPLEAKLKSDPGPSVYSDLQHLVDKETRAKVSAGAREVLERVEADAKARWKLAKNLEDEDRFVRAAQAYREIEDQYRPLDISRAAGKERLRILHTDDYKAEQMLDEARKVKEEGHAEKWQAMLAELIQKYPHSPAARAAQDLLKG